MQQLIKHKAKYATLVCSALFLSSYACATSIANQCDMAAVKIVFDDNGNLNSAETMNNGGFEYLNGDRTILSSLPCKSDNLIMETSFSGEASTERLNSVWSKIEQAVRFLEDNNLSQNVHTLKINTNSKHMSRFDHDGVFISVYVAQDKVK